MKKTMPYVEPVADSCRAGLDRGLIDKATALYDEGKTLEGLHTLLDALDPEVRKRCGNADGTRFAIPHGSIIVHIDVEADRLHIHADFLNLPEKGRVAMLRQLADMNVNRLLLPRFVKRGDRIDMEYSCLMSETHPYKIYGILRNICSVGDRYDDEFCTRFGATRCYTPAVRPFAADVARRVCRSVRDICREALAAVAEYNARRLYGCSWNVLGTALYQIAWFARPQGQLSNDIDRAVDALDEELPVEELVNRCTAFLQQLAAKTDDVMGADLYETDTLVSLKRDCTLQNLQEDLEDVFDEATAAMQSKDYERAAVRLTYMLYEVFYYNNLTPDVAAVLAKALASSGGLPVEQAAEILWNAVNSIMEGEIDALPDLTGVDPAAAGEAAAEMQRKMAEAMQGDAMQQLQQNMADAMARGDMAEYMRLAGQLQQTIMGSFK